MSDKNEIDGVRKLFEEQKGVAPLKIIIADDDSSVRRALKRHIESLETVRPVDIREAGDGREALRLFTMDDGADIIITDAQMPNVDDSKMPNKDGYQLIEDIRTIQQNSLYNKNPKILMLSTLYDTDHIHKSLAAGANHVYQKGNIFHLEEMMDLLTQEAGGEKRALQTGKPEQDHNQEKFTPPSHE